jgi:hypothetical protein
MANADSESNKGQIQRLMVGTDKSCQVGELKLSDQSNGEGKSNGKSEGKSNGKSEGKSNGKSEGKSNGKSAANENNSDKSSLSNQAQKLIDQLTAKNTPSSLTAKALLQTAKSTYTTNTTAAMLAYSGAVSMALLTCNNTINSARSIYDPKVVGAKTALKAAQLAATTEEAKKAASTASKLAINAAAAAFKTAAHIALTKYQGDLTSAQNIQRLALAPHNAALSAAILTARQALV